MSFRTLQRAAFADRPSSPAATRVQEVPCCRRRTASCTSSSSVRAYSVDFATRPSVPALRPVLLCSALVFLPGDEASVAWNYFRMELGRAHPCDGSCMQLPLFSISATLQRRAFRTQIPVAARKHCTGSDSRPSNSHSHEVKIVCTSETFTESSQT